MTPVVQVLLTLDQVKMAESAIGFAVEGFTPDDTDGVDQYYQLQGFLQLVAAEPEKFRPQGKLATTVRRITRPIKGPAQPPRSVRKRRQLRKQSFQRRTRAEKQEAARLWNEAVAKHEADMAELAKYAAEYAPEVEAVAPPAA